MLTDPNALAAKAAEHAYCAGNLVTCDGYYEFDLDAAQAAIAAVYAPRLAELEAEVARLRGALEVCAAARREAVREYQSQISQLADDDIKDAYRRGRYDGRVQGHISEGRWWCFGVMCGVVLSVLVWSFWP